MGRPGSGRGRNPNLEAMLEERAAGATLRAIGSRYGITAEGVRQLCKRYPQQAEPRGPSRLDRILDRLEEAIERRYRKARLLLQLLRDPDLKDFVEALVLRDDSKQPAIPSPTAEQPASADISPPSIQ